MSKKYRVYLSGQEHKHFEKLVRQGKAHAHKLLYARILPKADEGGLASWTDERESPMPSRLASPRWRASGSATVKRA